MPLGPFVNWAEKAKQDAMDAYKAAASDKANHNGVYFTAERVDYDTPGSS